MRRIKQVAVQRMEAMEKCHQTERAQGQSLWYRVECKLKKNIVGMHDKVEEANREAE
jgi:hypothetical protein